MSIQRPHITPKTLLLLLLLGVAVASLVFYQRSTALTLSDSPENREILDAIHRFDELYAEAHRTGDGSLLAEILVDDPLYLREIGDERTRELQEYVALVSGPERAERIGYLTAMQNKLSHRLAGEQLLREEMAKASAEGRSWSAEDEQGLAERNFGQIPALPSAGIAPRVLTLDQFRTIRIDGDRARAVYDGGIRTETALLVRKDGQWFIAGIF